MSDRVRSSQSRGSTTARRPPRVQPSGKKSQPPTGGYARGGAAQGGAAKGGSGGRGPAGSGKQPVGRVGKPQLTKNEKRAAARAAREAAAAAAAKRRYRRQWTLAIVATLVVAALIVGGFVVFGGKHKGTAKANPSASASAAAFPSLPPGTNPALATKPTVKAGTGTLTSLKKTTLIQGTGPAVASGQSLTVNYVGVSYQSGTEFDSSWKNSQEFTFTVGQGKVIPGWDQGLIGVKVGSRVQLDIPSNLAYGDNPTDGSPAGPLRFVIDVLAAK